MRARTRVVQKVVGLKRERVDPVKQQAATWFCLQENAELFRADTTSQSWKDYVNYIDSMVLNEFDQFIRKSLNYLMDNMVADV